MNLNAVEHLHLCRGQLEVKYVIILFRIGGSGGSVGAGADGHNALVIHDPAEAHLGDRLVVRFGNGCHLRVGERTCGNPAKRISA